MHKSCEVCLKISRYFYCCIGKLVTVMYGNLSPNARGNRPHGIGIISCNLMPLLSFKQFHRIHLHVRSLLRMESVGWGCGKVKFSGANCGQVCVHATCRPTKLPFYQNFAPKTMDSRTRLRRADNMGFYILVLGFRRWHQVATFIFRASFHFKRLRLIKWFQTVRCLITWKRLNDVWKYSPLCFIFLDLWAPVKEGQWHQFTRQSLFHR